MKNLKQIEKEITLEFERKFYLYFNQSNVPSPTINGIGWDIKQFIKSYIIPKIIKQVVETVPAKENKDNCCTVGNDCADQARIDGYNIHVEEIKKWKEEVKKSLI